MKKKLAGGVMMLAAVTMLTGCHMNHEWQEATCTTPRTCSECGETEGEALGHTWQEATCTEPKTCSVCGETEGEALGHEWVEATYTEPKTCSRCGQTEGEPLPQPYVEANNLTFSKETSFAIQGVRYNTNDRTNYEFAEMQMQIESITEEDGPEEGTRVIHLVVATDGEIWSDGQGHNRLSLSTPSPYLYDMYTGRKVPSAYMKEDMQAETQLETEWEGMSYTISYNERTEWKQGDWVGEYSPLGVHIYSDITIPKDYDGLILGVTPLTEWEIEQKEAGTVDETEKYLMEEWTEETRLFRIDELL